MSTAAASTAAPFDWKFFGLRTIHESIYLGIPNQPERIANRGLDALANNQIKTNRGVAFYSYVKQWAAQASPLLAKHKNQPGKAMDRVLALAYWRYKKCVKSYGYQVDDNMEVTLVSNVSYKAT